MNMILHDDGHTNVIAADGLLPVKDRDADHEDRSRTGRIRRAFIPAHRTPALPITALISSSRIRRSVLLSS